MSHPSSDRPVALIVGANKGIGFETARQLGNDHAMTVLLRARDVARGREAAEKVTALGPVMNAGMEPAEAVRHRRSPKGE